MPQISPFAQRFDQLPPSLPVFPLTGTVLLPGGVLPLNIFEPRYINMIQDAMRSNQLIGMIQPADRQVSDDLQQVGCAGRIVRYEEIPDGRFGILLAGLCRFSVKQELECVRGYRIVEPDWSNYENDYQPPIGPSEPSLKQFMTLLKNYCANNNLRVDWSITERLSTNELVSNSILHLPLNALEKQRLLEDTTLADRVSTLIKLLENNSGTVATIH